MKFRLGGLHLQLLGLVFLPLSLLLLALAVFGTRLHQQAMRRLVAERDERSVRAAAAALSEQLHHRQSALRTLALRLQDGVEPARVLAEAAYLTSDFDAGLALVNDEGDVLAGNLDPTLAVEGSFSAWVEGLPEGEPGFLLLPDREARVAVGLRTRAGNLVGAFALEPLARAVLLTTGGASYYTSLLVDQAGHLLFGSGAVPSADALLAHPGVQAALRGETGSSYLPAEDGEHVVAYAPVEPVGWAVVIEEPWQEVSSPYLDLTAAAPLALIPALLLALAALWVGARQVIGPLRALEDRAERAAEGDLQALRQNVGGILEIRQLQHTLRWMAERLLEAQQALRRYIIVITQAQEEERRRLARELHDETIQDLIALDQRVQMLQMQPPASRQVLREALADLRRSLQETVAKVRWLTRGLRPVYLEDLGLVPALEMLVRDARQQTGLDIEFALVGDPCRLPPEAELAVYRIVQESLTNVARHARARHAWVRVSFDDTYRLRVEVRDDGVGFEPPERPSDLSARGHFGIMGMYERAEALGGRLSVESRPGTGTTIRLDLPLRGGQPETPPKGPCTGG